MPTQTINSMGNDVLSRYSYLLQPIRDMTKNWEIDVAAQLEEYLTEIEKIQISFDGGKTTMNFAEAALLIQGSACIYSKKVEYLYTLVYQTLDLIASKKRLQQAVSVDDQGQDDDVSFKEEEDFLSLDDMKEAKNIDLKEGNDDVISNESSQIIPRTPLALIPLGEKDKQDVLLSQTGEVLGSRNDFKMNTCTVHSSGALLLDLANLSLLDRSFKRLPTSTPQLPTVPGNPGVDVNEPVQHLPQGSGDEEFKTPDINDFNDDYDCGGMIDDPTAPDVQEEQNEDIAEGRDKQQQAPPVHKLQARDSWELLDPHDPGSAGEKPFKKGKPFKFPPSIMAANNEHKKKRKRTEDKEHKPIVTPLHEFCAMAFHSHASKFPKNPLKAPSFIEFEYLYWVEYRRRQTLEKKQKKMLSQYLTQEQLEDLDPVEPEYPEDEALPAHDGAAYAGIEGGDDYDDDDDFGGPGDDGNAAEPIEPIALEECPDELVVSSYEDLVRQYVEGYLVEAQQYAQETDLSKRVRDWENKILPTLQEEETHDQFDIHKYGEDILGSFKEKRIIPFSEMMKSKKPFQICRYFLATLQLANNYNVEISSGGIAEKGVDTMKLKLLHRTPVHAGISSYRAPSIVT